MFANLQLSGSQFVVSLRSNSSLCWASFLPGTADVPDTCEQWFSGMGYRYIGLADCRVATPFVGNGTVQYPLISITQAAAGQPAVFNAWRGVPKEGASPGCTDAHDGSIMLYDSPNTGSSLMWVDGVMQSTSNSSLCVGIVGTVLTFELCSASALLWDAVTLSFSAPPVSVQGAGGSPTPSPSQTTDTVQRITVTGYAMATFDSPQIAHFTGALASFLGISPQYVRIDGVADLPGPAILADVTVTCASSCPQAVAALSSLSTPSGLEALAGKMRSYGLVNTTGVSLSHYGSPPGPPSSSKDGGLSTLAWALIALGVAAAIGGAALIFACVRMNKRKRGAGAVPGFRFKTQRMSLD